MLSQWASDIAAHTTSHPGPPPTPTPLTAADASTPSDTRRPGSLQGGPEQPFHSGFRLVLSGAATKCTPAPTQLAALQQVVDVTVVDFSTVVKIISGVEAETAAEYINYTAANAAGFGGKTVSAMRLSTTADLLREEHCEEVAVPATLEQYEATMESLVENAVTALESNTPIQLTGGERCAE